MKPAHNLQEDVVYYATSDANNFILYFNTIDTELDEYYITDIIHMESLDNELDDNDLYHWYDINDFTFHYLEDFETADPSYYYDKYPELFI